MIVVSQNFTCKMGNSPVNLLPSTPVLSSFNQGLELQAFFKAQNWVETSEYEKEPQQQAEHICISFNLRHHNLGYKISGKKTWKKTMSFKEENQLGAKNEAKFYVFQNR